MESLIGQSIGRYHILEQPSEGGMAVVYKALDTSLQRHVAIKMILQGANYLRRCSRRCLKNAG